MIDVRILGYTSPVAEQEFASLTPTATIQNAGTVNCNVIGAVHIYRTSTGAAIYTSVLRPTQVDAGTTVDIAALTPWSPPAPLDNEYFITCELTATSIPPAEPQTGFASLGPYGFDIKPLGMGPAPAAHATTHEEGGSDPVYTELLPATETDTALRLAPDGTGGVEWAAIPAAKGAFSEATNATPTPNASLYSQYALTALDTDADFQVPTGVPVDGQKLIIRILDDSTPRNLTWNAVYASRGATLPAVTTSGKTHYVGLIYNAALTTWDCVAATVEA